MRVFNLKDVQHKELSSDREKFSLSAVLTDLIGFEKVFIHHDIIPQGRHSSSPHSHSLKEEMVIVLEGYPTAHLGDIAKKLKPGDFVGFKAGEIHYLENTASVDAHLLVICSKDDKDIITY